MMYAERAAATMARYRQTAATATDEAAVKSPELFPVWEAGGVSYAVGDRVRYGDLLYKCLTAHTSQESWTPDTAPSLWVRIDDPAVEWPEWRQPTGSMDAYPKGSKVSYKGKHYISQIDANTAEPGTDERWWKQAE